MNRSDMRTNIALHLGTTVDGALSQAELNRAISQAVAEASRYVPDMLHEEIHFELDVSGESFTSSHNNEVALANGEIQKDSDTVTNAAATVTYTRDDDYEIDYVNGRINVLSTGDMSNSTVYKITYKRSQVIMSTTSLLTAPITVLAVEYPIDEVPMSWCAFEWHGNSLVIRTKGRQSQTRIADEDEIRVWYTSEWDDPIDGASGSYPRFLDEIIVLGASGYALQMEARTQEHASITDLGSARTAIASASSPTALATALAAAISAFGNMATSIVKASGTSSKPFELALAAMALSRTQLALSNIALDDMNTHKTTAVTAAGNAATELALANIEFDSASAEFVIANTEFDVANSEFDTANAELDIAKAKFDTATTEFGVANSEFDTANVELDKADTHIATTAVARTDEMDDYMTGGTNGATVPLDLIQAELTLANAALDKVAVAGADTDTTLNKINAIINTDANTALDKVEVHTTTDAETALDFSSSVLHAVSNSAQKTLNDANTTPFADINTALDKIKSELQDATRTADAYLNVGDDLINTVNTGLEPAAENRRYAETKIAMARAYADEGIARVAEVRSLTDIAQQRIAMANTFVNESSQRIAMSQVFINEGQARVAMSLGFVQEAAQRLGMATAFINESTGRVALSQTYIAEAATRLGIADRFGSQADREILIGQSLTASGNGYTQNATGYVQNATGYMQNAIGYSQNASGYSQNATGYVQNGRGYVDNANGYIQNGNGYIQNALGYIAEANTRLAMAQRLAEEAAGRQNEAQSYLNEAGTQISAGQLVLNIASEYRSQAEGYFSEVDRRLAIETRLLSMSGGYQQNALQLSATSNLMRVEANEILARFKQQLEDRRQVLTQRSIAAVIQWS